MQKIKIRAFTLIELLVVIAIIGILSALIVVGMSSTNQKATIAKSQVFANSLRNSLMSEMVSEWKLDDGTGNSTTKDSWASVYTNTGTLGSGAVGDVAEPLWISNDCVSGNCLDFDGTDDYVNFGTNSSLSMGTRDHTVSLWAKFYNATALAHESLIYCGGASTGTDKDGYLIRRENGTSRLRCFFSDGSLDYSYDYLSAAGSVVGGVWYNIVVVFDRDVSVQAYINGVKQTGYSLDITTRQLSVQNYIGLYIGGLSSYFAGKMDEVRIFHSMATMSQIQQNYFAGLNKLFATQNINTSEYQQRIAELISNYATE
ncbi:MAG: LamG-like jellyroll fold domain-containing protein [Candidatus Paceibacterota bacterium]